MQMPASPFLSAELEGTEAWLPPHHVSLPTIEPHEDTSDWQSLNIMQNPSCIGVQQREDSFPLQPLHYQKASRRMEWILSNLIHGIHTTGKAYNVLPSPWKMKSLDKCLNPDKRKIEPIISNPASQTPKHAPTLFPLPDFLSQWRHQHSPQKSERPPATTSTPILLPWYLSDLFPPLLLRGGLV